MPIGKIVIALLVALLLAGGVYSYSFSAGADPAEEEFVRTLRTQPYFATNTDEELLDMGEMICSGLDDDISLTAISLVGPAIWVPAHDYGFLIGATTILCPEHEQTIRDYYGI